MKSCFHIARHASCETQYEWIGGEWDRSASNERATPNDRNFAVVAHEVVTRRKSGQLTEIEYGELVNYFESH
jgi:hypothetical protein